MNNKDMANRWIKDAMPALQLVMDACTRVTEAGSSWNSACRSCGLDPRRTRAAVLRLMRCDSRVPALEDTGTVDILDGYEHFYDEVFRAKVAEQSTLPPDYKDAVRQVLGRITSGNADILERRFGICKYEGEPSSYVRIAETTGIPQGTAQRMEYRALYECRDAENRDILRYGPEKYALRKAYQQECRRKELAQMAKSHEEMLEKLDAWHKRQDTKGLDDPFYVVFRECKEMSIHELDSMLSARAANALQRKSPTAAIPDTVYDLIMMDVEKLLSIRNTGTKTAYEILAALDTWLDERYGLSSAQLRKKFEGYVYENMVLDPESCGSCEHGEACPHNGQGAERAY